MNQETIVEVNVEEIMQEIRRKARMAEEMSKLPAFESIPFRDQKTYRSIVSIGSDQQADWAEYLECLDYINRSWDIPYYWSFGPNNSIKVFLKRVVRKLTKCIIPPILARQNEMNAHFVRCFNQLRWVAEESIASNRTLSQELEQVKQSSIERERSLQAEIEQQQKRLNDLIEEQKAQLELLSLRCQELSERQMAEKQSYDERFGAMESNRQEMQEALSVGRNEILHISESLKGLPITPMASAADMDTRLEWQFSSQAGEDMIIEYIFRMLAFDSKQCTYLDLGANHAKFLSNTYYFYQKGARGVLVEANPALIGELKFYRSEDVVLNRCISTESGKAVDFYVLSGDGLSTPNKEQAEEAIKINPTLSIERTVAVKTITPNEILEKYFDGAPTFMNVDIEGKDLEILRSIDFEAHRPFVISVEMIPYRTQLVVGEKNQAVIELMEQNDYVEYAFTGINSIFIDKRKIEQKER